jgi:hypothetical protein
MTSAARITAVGKYLAALSTSLPRETPQDPGDMGSRTSSGKLRRQLHILYLLNDLFHHVKYHGGAFMVYEVVASTLQPFILPLVTSAASYDKERYAKQHRKITQLLEEWSKNAYYGPAHMKLLQDAALRVANTEPEKEASKNPPENGGNGTLGTSKIEVPYMMPANHGELSAPYYDLPVGNMIPHIIPNSATPIDQRQIKPLQFTAGPAGANLVEVLKEFMKGVDVLYGQGSQDSDGIPLDIDELGQPLIRDEITGEIIDGETYYGWSKTFCKNMKQKRLGKLGSRSRGRSESYEGSLSPRKRRRYSSSAESRSPSRTRLNQRRGQPANRRSESYSPPRSRSRNRSRSPYQRHQQDHSHEKSRSQSYSPPINISSDQPTPPVVQPNPQSVSDIYNQPTVPTSIPFPAVAFGPNGLPIPPPPPPPPNYTGPWPPPPPPVGLNSGIYPPLGFVQPPPPSQYITSAALGNVGDGSRDPRRQSGRGRGNRGGWRG